ncbi:cellulose biosynthesis cyclic di-GMP-binding regulatory protein BcsB [Amorphus sp. 3PC139-8]|uniref:cellulose biosynthesis cyclic di-GMP-binding regulatory protein BcsB n=1 Tax=Amorphus sp. 3PC139-8 TaxID=2735676 RepID=UPI00345DC78E
MTPKQRPHRFARSLVLAVTIAAVAGLAAHAQDVSPFQINPSERTGASGPPPSTSGGAPSSSRSSAPSSTGQSSGPTGQSQNYGSQPAPSFGAGGSQSAPAFGSPNLSETTDQYFNAAPSSNDRILQGGQPAPSTGGQQGSSPFNMGGTQSPQGQAQSGQSAAPSQTPNRSLPPIETLTNPQSAPRWSGPAPDQSTEQSPLPIDSSDQVDALNRFFETDTSGQRTMYISLGDQETRIPAVDRPIVPYAQLRLEGEIDFQSWTIYLSAAEAARGATLSVAFTNSVLVLPEASELRVFLNTREILSTQIDSPDATKVVAVSLDPEMVRPGANAIRFEVDQRHRIDCSIQATYELWTRIEPRLTGLSFRGGDVPLQSLAELPAVGVDTTGATRIRVLQPAAMTAASQDRILDAAQIMSVRGRFSHPLVEILTPGMPAPPQPGVVNLVMGTYREVSSLVRDVPSEAQNSTVVTLQDRPDIGPTVFVTAPNAHELPVALRRLAAEINPISRVAPIAATPPWNSPDAIRIDGASRVTLREAGVFTEEFSGRRFQTHFQVKLPPDFFAAAYGQATIELDAAYTPMVLPGSRLNVYVNDVLATALSFTTGNGRVFNKFPVRILLKNFRPGINDIRIQVNLRTDADELCLPGGTVSTQQRFVLFNTTEFVFPQFARIGRIPDLASFSADGFPYSRDDRPIAVRVSGDSRDTLGATASLLARLATTRGAPFNTVAVDSVANLVGRPAIVVGSFGEVTPLVLQQTRVDRVIPGSWLAPRGSVSRSQPQGLDQYDAILQRLRQQTRERDSLRNRNVSVDDYGRTDDIATDERIQTRDLYEQWSTQVGQSTNLSSLLEDIGDWFDRQFDVSFGFLASDEEADASNVISDQATLVIAQASAPQADDQAWTLVTAPTPALLSAGVASMSSEHQWNRLAGRLTAFSLDTDSVQSFQADNPVFVVTQPLSFRNMRLIAANWFSLNNGIYAIAMIGVAVLLGIFTYRVIKPMGRQP